MPRKYSGIGQCKKYPGIGQCKKYPGIAWAFPIITCLVLFQRVLAGRLRNLMLGKASVPEEKRPSRPVVGMVTYKYMNLVGE
jgi:hypothetical protein